MISPCPCVILSFQAFEHFDGGASMNAPSPRVKMCNAEQFAFARLAISFLKIHVDPWIGVELMSMPSRHTAFEYVGFLKTSLQTVVCSKQVAFGE
jgi:hypothetical protein